MTLGERIAREETERIEAITKQVTSLVPNLEEDPEFEEANRAFNDGARVIAIQRALRAENPDEFLKVEMLYHGFGGGFFRQMVYAIGRGKIHSGGRDKESLFYLGRWNEISESRQDGVYPITLERIRSFQPI